MTYAEYEKLPGVRWSTLRAMATSAMHYVSAVEAIGQREESRPMRLGRAIHCLLLDGRDAFRERWIACDLDRRTKLWKEFEVAHAHLEILKGAEMTLVERSVAALTRHAVAKRFLAGAREQVVTWLDRTGLRCKARVDLYTSARLLDLKSTSRLDMRDFGRSAARLGFHCQLAMYMDGLRQNGWDGLPEPIVLGVETSRPFDVVAFEVPMVAIEAGRREYQRLLVQVAECEAKGEWPGRAPDRLVQLELPEWAFGGFDDGLADVEEGVIFE